jgi:pyruvate/2-oxoglutarate dehydrogenase complex dihydrolipoamide acyltransferase (E2) component
MELTMPKFGAMESGEISKWLKKEGDSFAEGEELCEISTEKLTNFFEARFNGTLDKILVQEGEEAKVGAPIAIATKLSD